MTDMADAKHLIVALALTLGLATPASAETSLPGAWTGSGSVVLPSGATEKARCKVNFRKQDGASYAMNAVCASSSAKISQTATLEQVSANRYRGQFFNPDYNVSGNISLTVNGNSLSASLNGAGATAFFNLSR
jgi:hypothetical protein